MAIATAAAIIGALASVAGGLMGAYENNKTSNMYNARGAGLDSELYKGALENDGTRAYLKTLDSNVRDKYAGLNNSAVSTGATFENSLAQKQSANETMSNAISTAIQNGEGRKYNLLSLRDRVDANKAMVNAQRAQNWVDIARGVSQTANNLGELYLDNYDKDGSTPYLQWNGAKNKAENSLKNYGKPSTQYGKYGAAPDMSNSIPKIMSPDELDSARRKYLDEMGYEKAIDNHIM